MNSYDLLFWSGVYFLVIRIARSGKGVSRPMLGLVFGLGLSNRIGLLVLGAALAPALRLKEPADLVIYMQDLGIAPKAQEVWQKSELPQHLSDRFAWKELAQSVST